nr:DUF4870 domain-containing protein [Microbacterium sp. No. 7]
MSPSDQRLWATLIHVGGIFLGFLPGLVGYLVMRDRDAFVRGHAVTALNFQITIVIAVAAGFVLSFVGIGVLVILAAYLLDLVFSIIAAVRANQGVPYTYPLAIPFIR